MKIALGSIGLHGFVGFHGVLALSSALWLAACGGGSSEPETPADVDTDAEPSEEAPSAATDEPASAEEASSEAADPEPEEKKKGVDPEEVLIREGTTFMLNFRESDIGKKAEAACEKKSGDDVAKKANCLSKALNSMDREGIMFDEDGGQWWYIRIGIEKGAKVEYNRVQVAVGKPEGNTIKLVTSGQDKAARRKGKVPSELKFEVPDEYTVILHDPDRGRMVFEPKLGLFDE